MNSSLKFLSSVLLALSIVKYCHSTAVRSAHAIGYEFEDVAADTTHYCEKIKEQADEIQNETLDARDEVGFMDTVAAEESMYAYDYIISKSRDIIAICDLCIQTLSESLNKNDSLVDKSEDLAAMLEQPFYNASEASLLVTSIQDEINQGHVNVHLWGADIENIAQNIIAAARDAQEEIGESALTSDEALDDAKDTKNEVKTFANDIIKMTEDMIHDAHESYMDMLDDADVVSRAL